MRICRRCTPQENTVIAEDAALTPQQRLAQSRRALVWRLEGGKPSRSTANVDVVGPVFASGTAASPLLDDATTERPRPSDRLIWMTVIRNVAQRWWRRHPANAAGQLARPLLERYAREQPVKLLASAAAIGAVTVLVKPWRLLSITALLAAILKTSDVADLVTTLMQKNSSPQKDSP
jgi:hypothetical protein